MMIKLQRWGNSQGIRLPKTLVQDMNLRENEILDVKKDGDVIIIRKARKHLSFKERMKGYTGDYRPTEWDTGSPRGDEIF